MSTKSLTEFDPWLSRPHAPAALVGRHYLMPVEGKDAVIFPPTYAPPQDKREWSGYNVDTFPDGSSVCLIDSVGSQANRLEALFMHPPYQHLVPQVWVKLTGANGATLKVNLLEAGHRAADAVVRYSSLADQINKGFLGAAAGDAVPLARLAPTSLVFGVWDSRGTQVKIPRLVRAVIRAYNVRLLHRSATYIPPVDYEKEGIIAELSEKVEKSRRAEEGLIHNPASATPGGVQVLGEIRRDSLVNLAALQSLGSPDPGLALALRRYLLGLALVVFTAPPETCLREGCELVLDPDQPPQVTLVYPSGRRAPFSLTAEDALDYAQLAAEAFDVPRDSIECNFDPQAVTQALKKSKEERKKTAGA